MYFFDLPNSIVKLHFRKLPKLFREKKHNTKNQEMLPTKNTGGKYKKIIARPQ